MIIRKYGLLLRRLTEEDIEMVRGHRNSRKIAKNMFYQETITQDMQRKWFLSINNPFNYFFIIEHKGKKVGLISGKAINFQKRSLETGIMLWDDACLNTLVPASASLLLMDICFSFLEIRKMFVTVKASNKWVIHFLKDLGYEFEAEFPNEDKQIHVLTPDNYYLKVARLRNIVARMNSDNANVAESDIDLSEVNKSDIELLYADNPRYLQIKFDALLMNK